MWLDAFTKVAEKKERALALGAKGFSPSVVSFFHFTLKVLLKVGSVFGPEIATVLFAWLGSGPVLPLDSRDYRHASEGEQTTGMHYANEMVVRHGADLMHPIHPSFTQMPKQGGAIIVSPGYIRYLRPVVCQAHWLTRADSRARSRRVPCTLYTQTIFGLRIPAR